MGGNDVFHDSVKKVSGAVGRQCADPRGPGQGGATIRLSLLSVHGAQRGTASLTTWER